MQNSHCSYFNRLRNALVVIMNNFTKKEIHTLWQMITWAIEEYHEPDSSYVLRDKLKARLDSYGKPMYCPEGGDDE